MSEPFPHHTVFAQWLDDASRTRDDDEMKVYLLAAEERGVAAVDLGDIVEACTEVCDELQALVGRVPSPARLEDALVAIDLSLSHAMWHWNSLREVLSRRGLWDQTDAAE